MHIGAALFGWWTYHKRDGLNVAVLIRQIHLGLLYDHDIPSVELCGRRPHGMQHSRQERQHCRSHGASSVRRCLHLRVQRSDGFMRPTSVHLVHQLR